MTHRLTIFFSMFTFLYAITFGIFLTDILRIPAPLLFGFLPMVFSTSPLKSFAYHRELIIASIALFFYNVVGNSDYKSFFAAIMTIIPCACYFNYFIGTSVFRYKLSIVIFFALLGISMVVLLADHFDPELIDPIRSLALDEPVKQTPSGIANTQFTFGYQLAAFSTFAVVGVLAIQRNYLVTLAAICFSILCLYLGMNRSAFLVFLITVIIFLISFYRLRGILIIGICFVLAIGIYANFTRDPGSNKNNILAKSQAKEANDFNRVTMSKENLKIIADYPYGLIFYGKTWEEVTYRNSLFPGGLSSHNAYLMFITYLGPVLGLGLLIAIYNPIIRVFFKQRKVLSSRKNGLLTTLLFSFIAVSLNSVSHNGWLLSIDGPTLFLYFAILHYHKIQELNPVPLIIEQ